VQTVLSSPAEGAGAAGTLHLIVLQCARRHLYIANPYFIPTRALLNCWLVRAGGESQSS